MFGLGASEMVLIGIVALIVIGPKDLPGMFRTLGQFTGKARGMAREFSRAMEAAADESGIKDVSNTIRAASDPKKFGTDALKNATGFSKPGPMPSTRAEAMADAADHLSTDAHETAARAKVPAKPAVTPAAAKPATPVKPAATAAKPAATKAAAAKPKPAAAPKAAATPKAPAKPRRAASPKPAPAGPEDQS
ncbi:MULTISPECIES: Sec-independent protein translocase protein TatB [unclassified Yoonia]|uniref:Sec-independent protein translocase protein TatB n=1 Tax=unclassified Yoonia TaxID=2629118 RepID=UPI002AFDF117|nr:MULTISPECIES: Sec-independent protein translocase protein TatB [unclassified Yoonia]